jgi:protein-tyrosine phosphatase
MHWKLDDNVWFGDWTSPIELKDEVNTIINVAHSFSRRRKRHVYWQNLEQLNSKILYVRLAKKDHDEVDSQYLAAFESVVNQAVLADKLPILCHCQMGRHRGPTSGVAAAWILNGKTRESLEHFIKKATELRPKYVRSVNTPYRKTMTDLMIQQSVEGV